MCKLGKRARKKVSLLVAGFVHEDQYLTQSQNLKEAEVIVQLVMSYIGTNFLIVTPYNKQRELITKLLQTAIAQYNRLHPGGHLPAGLADDRVRSIDTSQGMSFLHESQWFR